MPDRPGPQAPADEMRAFIAEAAHRAALYATHAVDYAAIGDDRGLARSMRLLASCAIAGGECLPLLAAAAARDAALREAARAYQGRGTGEERRENGADAGQGEDAA